jgi:predicted outer membrane protein
MRFFQTLLVATAAVPALVMIVPFQDTQKPRTNPPQEPRTGAPMEPRTSQDPMRSTSATETDAVLATWLLTANNNEIAVSQIAVQRAQDPEVKQFAQKMVDDHRKLAEKLQPFAPTGTSGMFGANRPADDDPRPGSDGTDGDHRAGGTDGTGQGRAHEASSPRSSGAGHVDHVALLQDLGRQCLETARKELDQKQGAEFDRCYMGMAIGAHMKANDEMIVFQKHASSQLRSVIADGQPTVAAHLQHAKDLARKLEGKTRTGEVRTDRTTPDRDRDE